MELKTGRQPKSHLAIEPNLANELRYVAKRERLQLSDMFRKIFAHWLKGEGKKYAQEVSLDDD
jgi:hypothetical protein